MPVAFYMDEHVDGAITRGLRRRGVDVLRVQDDAHASTDDELILDRAARSAASSSPRTKTSSPLPNSARSTAFRSPVLCSPTKTDQRSGRA